MSWGEANDHLAELASSAARGLRRMPRAFSTRAAGYVRRAQNPDGGFSGRRGGSEPYYTSFALRAADLLGIEDDELWRGAGRYVRPDRFTVGDVVECHCLLHACWLVAMHGCRTWREDTHARMRRQVTGVLASRRVPGGGFAKQPGGAPSVYHTFLALLCYGLLGQAMPDARATVDAVRSRQREDGGFGDVPVEGAAGVSGVNPTAAAVQVLSMHNALDGAVAERAAAFVAAAQREDGGVAAYPGAPVSDLMSTFTGLVTLLEVGAVNRIRLAALARFIRAVAAGDGGFRATVSDTRTDPEYAYYGLAALGLVRLQAPDSECGCGRRDP